MYHHCQDLHQFPLLYLLLLYFHQFLPLLFLLPLYLLPYLLLPYLLLPYLLLPYLLSRTFFSRTFFSCIFTSSFSSVPSSLVLLSSVLFEGLTLFYCFCRFRINTIDQTIAIVIDFITVLCGACICFRIFIITVAFIWISIAI